MMIRLEKYYSDRVSLPFYLLLVYFYSAYFSLLRFEISLQYPPATLHKLTNFSADTPFQYRVLIPFIVHYINSFISIDLIILYRLIEFLAVFLLILFYKKYLNNFIISEKYSFYFSLSICLILPFNFLLPKICNFYYPSDISSILFTVIGLNYIYKNKLAYFYIVFLFATINRETSLFLSFIFLIHYYNKITFLKLSYHGILQGIIWISIKSFLYHTFSDNPGRGLFESDHLSSNISFMINPFNFLYFFSNMGFIWIFTFKFLDRIQNIFLTKSLWVILPHFLIMLFVGNIFELRIFGEMIPIVLTPLLTVIMDSMYNNNETS